MHKYLSFLFPQQCKMCQRQIKQRQEGRNVVIPVIFAPFKLLHFFQIFCFFSGRLSRMSNVHRKKLILETEEGIDPNIRLFTEVPLATFEGEPEPSCKSANRIENSQHSFRPMAFESQQQVASMELEHTSTRNSLFQRQEKMRLSNSRKAANPLKHQRIKNICLNVVKKMRLNNIYRTSVGEQAIEEFKNVERQNGWEISANVRFCWDVLASLVMLALFLSQTLLLVFHEINNGAAIDAIIILGILVFLGEIVFNLFSVRRKNGRKVKVLKEIVVRYMSGELVLDLSSLIVLICLLFTQNLEFNQLFVALAILKISNLLAKLHRIERKIFKTLCYEQYWQLFKIFLFNLAFAHTIAIILNLMVLPNPNHNWQVTRGISHNWWGERYVWSYYWATTIMLTVGFGDIVPSSYHQAIWVILIEIVSCIAFSYNISCLGNLIKSIRSQRYNITKDRKIFQNFAEKRGLPEKITKRVLHYIDESSHVKTRFNNVQEKQLIQRLPQGYKQEVLSVSNKSLLKSLTFFNQLLSKTTRELSKKIERNIYYPEQIVKFVNSDPHIYILEEGEIGFACHSPDSSLNRVTVDTVKRAEKSESFLLNTDFITLVHHSYDIRSKDYSIVHRLRFEDFKAILVSFPKDYEFYCFLRERSKYILDEYETVKCERCSAKHTKFSCPKLHFIPLQEHIIHRELHSRVQRTNNRQKTHGRINRRKQNALATDELSEQDKKKIVGLKSRGKHIRPQSSELLAPSDSIVDEIMSQSVKMSLGGKDEKYLTLFNTIMLMELRRQMKSKEENQQDDVWLINCDKIQEYSVFFPESNLRTILLSYQKLRNQSARSARE